MATLQCIALCLRPSDFLSKYLTLGNSITEYVIIPILVWSVLSSADSVMCFFLLKLFWLFEAATAKCDSQHSEQLY